MNRIYLMLRCITFMALGSLLLLPPFAPDAHAQMQARDRVLIDCKDIPKIRDETHYPGFDNIHRTNNLRRATGSAVVAKGENIYLGLRIVDENCIPVTNAELEVWQADFQGVYAHEDKIDRPKDEHFIGSGFARTNNLGEAFFLTIMPGITEEKSAPHINVKISHPRYKPFYTRVYFPEQPNNSTDEKLNEFSTPEQRKIIAKKALLRSRDVYIQNGATEQDVIYIMDITILGVDKFKRY